MPSQWRVGTLQYQKETFMPAAPPMLSLYRKKGKPLPRRPVAARFEDFFMGTLETEFERFDNPFPQLRFDNRPPQGYIWPIIEPKKGPPIPPLPPIIQKLMKFCWKCSEPSDNARVNTGVLIGTRGSAMQNSETKKWAYTPKYKQLSEEIVSSTYHPQQRPTPTNLTTTFPNDSKIASDWKVFDQIKRTNAVTFRGDSRDPNEILRAMKGFGPPNSRTDSHYIEWNIFDAFSDYLSRRYGRKLTIDRKKFTELVLAAVPARDEQSLLIDYMMWRKITDKEAIHLGRMVENECLKGYISTSRAIDTSLDFATAGGQRPGWLYVTLVHGGFVVPSGAHLNWGSQEGEIAQWGRIPAARIVGFRHVQQSGRLDGPIFLRSSFLDSEDEAATKIACIMSGWWGPS